MEVKATNVTNEELNKMKKFLSRFNIEMIVGIVWAFKGTYDSNSTGLIVGVIMYCTGRIMIELQDRN